MTYGALQPKTKRMIERDLDALFSPRAFYSPDIEELKKLGMQVLYREIKYKGRTLFLSETGAAALRRLTRSILELPSLVDAVSQREVATEVKHAYNQWIEQHLQPDGQEFTDAVAKTLLALVRLYHFLIKLEGLNIKDQDAIELGSVRIQRPDRAVLNKVEAGKVLNPELLFKQFDGGLWLIGKTTGSPDVALERFELQALITVGILAVSGAVLYQGAIWRSHVRALLSPTGHRAPVSLFRWEDTGDGPSLTRKSGVGQDLPIERKSVEYLTTTCFLQEMASLIDKTNRSELQNAIVRALYWMADAYSDRNPMMQFVKLWSCVECFFAITDEKITEANAKGIAAILVFGGYRVIAADKYADTKRRVKQLYKLRSTALHRGRFGHIDSTDIDEFSGWVAWIIITMVSLSVRGYTTLKQVNEQVLRLDRMSDPAQKGKE